MTLRAWLETLAEAEAIVSARAVLSRLNSDCVAEPPVIALEESPTWRERLWTAPSEMRIGLHEVAEAFGRSRSWCYKRTGSAAIDGIPCRRLDGELVFLVGELRAWWRSREESVHEGPSDPPALRTVS